MHNINLLLKTKIIYNSTQCVCIYNNNAFKNVFIFKIDKIFLNSKKVTLCFDHASHCSVRIFPMILMMLFPYIYIYIYEFP